MTFPRFSQWKQIFRVLKRGEKITLLVFFVLAIGSLGFLINDFYVSHTKVVPAFGGVYTEGVVGQPRFINPIYGETDDIDRTLIDLVYSGLQTYNKDGNIINDLANDYKISGDGKTYTFNLKNNIFWSDGQPLTADDIIFTIKTIQNSDYKSPLRANWIDVNVQKISETSLSFNLKQPYNSFLENCTLKIIPKHIWQNISPENFALSSYNLQPVGSGPFAFFNLAQTNTGFIQTLNLTSNRRYYANPSFLTGITFKFYEKTADLIASANARQIDGFSPANANQNNASLQKTIRQGFSTQPSFSTYSLQLPRYFAVFFNNQKTSLFFDANIRQALTHAVNKTELAQTVADQTKTKPSIVDSPVLPEFYGYQTPVNLYGFDITRSNALLDKSGFTKNDQGLRQKTTSKKPAFQFKSYLKIGSKGNEVTQLQACLARLSESFKSSLSTETNGTFGTGTENAVTEFQKKYLSSTKPTGETGVGTRQELNKQCVTPTSNVQPLQITIVTINQPELVLVANMLKNYWQTVGVTITVNAVSISELKPIIKNRNYDALLYGETLGMQPDLYPFWYSSQKQDPGLNLSEYENKTVDQLLKDARQTQDPAVKKQKLEQLQTQIIKDAPALFLYNPDYSYWVSKQVQGIDTTKIVDPAKRFENIVNWYLQTKRVWK